MMAVLLVAIHVQGFVQRGPSTVGKEEVDRQRGGDPDGGDEGEDSPGDDVLAGWSSRSNLTRAARCRS